MVYHLLPSSQSRAELIRQCCTWLEISYCGDQRIARGSRPTSHHRSCLVSGWGNRKIFFTRSCHFKCVLREAAQGCESVYDAIKRLVHNLSFTLHGSCFAPACTLLTLTLRANGATAPSPVDLTVVIHYSERRHAQGRVYKNDVT